MHILCTVFEITVEKKEEKMVRGNEGKEQKEAIFLKTPTLTDTMLTIFLFCFVLFYSLPPSVIISLGTKVELTL